MQFDDSDAILVSSRQQVVITGRKFMWLTTLILALMAEMPGSGLVKASDGKFDLSTRDASKTIRDVQVVIEVTGDLKLNADGKQVNRLPMRVSGTSRYDERTLVRVPEMDRSRTHAFTAMLKPSSRSATADLKRG